MAAEVMEWVSMTSVLVVGAVSLLIYWIWRSQQVYKTFDKLGIPGPRPDFFLGNAGQLSKGGFCHTFMEWNKKYGRCYGIYLPKTPSLVVSDPDMLRDLMVKKFGYFNNRTPQPALNVKPWSNNLTMLRDDHWKHIRSQLSPAFSSGKLKKMMPSIDRVTENLGNYIKTQAKTGEEVELKDLASRFTMDAIAGAAFGMQVDTLDNPKEPFNVQALRLLEQNWVLYVVLLFPWLSPVLRCFGISIISSEATSFFTNILDLAIKDRRMDKQRHGDFLQLLVNAQTEGESSGSVDAEIDHSAHLTTSKQWTRKGMNDDEVKANAIVFLVAGFTTTSTVLSFTLFHLAANPQILLKAQKEVDEKLGKSRVTYEIASDLTYVGMCMNESMRLFPPAFMLDRQAADDTTLGGYPVKKGTRMTIPVIAIHRDPEFWTDPEKYDPERHTPEAKAARHPFAFLPFGMGPRNCIGMRLAQLEIRMALATILQRYTPVLCDKSVYPPVIKPPETRMMAKDGLWVKFTPRD